jgi:hypothetical protein
MGSTQNFRLDNKKKSIKLKKNPNSPEIMALLSTSLFSPKSAT